MQSVADSPYSLAISQALAELADEAIVTIEEIATCMTRHVQQATGRTDAEVWVSEELDWWVVIDEIALEPWEADLIDGWMTPAAYLAAGKVVS